MTHAIAMDSQALAEDLHSFLRDLDPARWRDELEHGARQRLEQIRGRLDPLRERFDELRTSELAAEVAGYEVVRGRLDDLSLLLDSAVPARGLPGERMRAAWNDFRLEVLPVYEQLVASLEPLDIHVPSLRPTNYTRNAFHVANGVGVLVLVHYVLPQGWLLPVAAACAVMAWTFEGTRRISPAINRRLMWVFSKVAHPHEAWRVNSSTWFTTALLLLAMTGDLMLMSVSLAVLAVGDPIAAIIGRRFGSIKLVNGRSLQGTLAFFGVSFLAAMAVVGHFFPHLTPGAAVGMSVAGAASGALAELFARRVDDNLAIPTCVAAGTALAAFFLGIF